VEPEEIVTQTIRGITPKDFADAGRRGATIRQLACASFDRATSTLTAWVAPAPVPRASVFGRATGAQNAAVATGAFAGDITITGAGAGGDATAVAVIGDILAIARDRAAIVPAPRLSRPAKIMGRTDNAETAELAGRNHTQSTQTSQSKLFSAFSASSAFDPGLGERCVDRRIRAEVA
jgi:hypothetical protein